MVTNHKQTVQRHNTNRVTAYTIYSQNKVDYT